MTHEILNTTEGMPLNTNERFMRLAFTDQSEKILKNENNFNKEPGNIRVGFEIECSLIKPDGTSVSETERDDIVNSHNAFDVELGSSQIEWRTDPFYINNPNEMHQMMNQLGEREQYLASSARKIDARVLRSGSNPFVDIGDISRTKKLKYKEVPDFHNQNRKITDTIIGKKNQIDAGDASIVALFNSVQCNLEASSFGDAIDMTNRSLMIGPTIISIAGNSRFLEGKDLGVSDIRMLAWEKSHEIRTSEEIAHNKPTRVGPANKYYTDLKDYFKNVSQHDFILFDEEHALQIGIGLFWQDTRIKIINDSLVVEFRPISLQPTLTEDAAVMFFYLGRLLWSQKQQEPLLPIDLVKRNRQQAMENGINGNLISATNGRLKMEQAWKTLPQEIDKAEQMLITSGVTNEIAIKHMDILRKRAMEKQTPSDKLSEMYLNDKRKYGNRQALLNSFIQTNAII
ncbi:MAG TPA: glutamate-cysteine ligase family protein [Candidatus Levybacteria bacterium]|nr:glutamate-cysteine ligase family protein [Candidatus Levybacteria bacterium]